MKKNVLHTKSILWQFWSQVIRLGQTDKTFEEFIEFYRELADEFNFDLLNRNCRHLCIRCLDFLRPEVDARPRLRMLNKNLDKLNHIRAMTIAIIASNIKRLCEGILRLIATAFQHMTFETLSMWEEAWYQYLQELSERNDYWPKQTVTTYQTIEVTLFWFFYTNSLRFLQNVF